MLRLIRVAVSFIKLNNITLFWINGVSIFVCYGKRGTCVNKELGTINSNRNALLRKVWKIFKILLGSKLILHNCYQLP